MKIYRRTENWTGYSVVTEVDENGRYEQRAVWPDGKYSGHYKTTLAKMGWKSVREFLRNRPGFIQIER